jgi:hypothetical protein
MSNLTSYRQIQMLGARASAPTRSTGLGASLTDPDLQAAASALMDYLQTNGCTQNSFAECMAFQAAANAAGFTPPIKVDGKYGPCTQVALQAVIDAGWDATGNSGPSQSAPTSCFPGSCVNGKFIVDLTAAAQNAVSAINNDPNYCTDVSHPGSAVNTAVHEFKVSWNNSGNSPKLPYNGQYDDNTASALSQVLGTTAPTSCTRNYSFPPTNQQQQQQPTQPPTNQQQPTQQKATTTTSSNNTALIVVGVVAVAAIGGAALYLRSAKKRR